MSTLPPAPPVDADGERQTVDRLGVRDIRHVALIKNRGGGEQSTLAQFDISIGRPQSLPQDAAAALIDILHSYGQALSVRDFHDMLFRINAEFGAQSSRVVMHFPYFVTKPAQASEVGSRLDYDVSFIGRLDDDGLSVSIRVAVPLTRGQPRSQSAGDGTTFQHSLLTVTARIRGLLWIEELIEAVEQTTTRDYDGILDSADGKDWTGQAGANPRPTALLLRPVAERLRDDRRIAGYRLELENLQSGHKYASYAVIEHDNDDQ